MPVKTVYVYLPTIARRAGGLAGTMVNETHRTGAHESKILTFAQRWNNKIWREKRLPHQYLLMGITWGGMKKTLTWKKYLEKMNNQLI